ncbi:hypothetical protein FQA39_LY07639 [Lamprigera yunnana]|nr:hypothetical protein FQA39_LY07639 [Lamprigera yunnana]
MFSDTGLEFTLPAMRHLRGASKFSQEEMKRKIVVFTAVAKGDSRILDLTALAAKTDRTGLIGAECTCIHNSLTVVSLTKALASHSNGKMEFQVPSRRVAQKLLLPKACTATGREFKRQKC